MKILTASQFKQIDAFTIEHEPISSVDLMERAPTALADQIAERWDASVPVKVFAGPGNNGGDGYEMASILLERGFTKKRNSAGVFEWYGFRLRGSASAL